MLNVGGFLWSRNGADTKLSSIASKPQSPPLLNRARSPQRTFDVVNVNNAGSATVNAVLGSSNKRKTFPDSPPYCPTMVCAPTSKHREVTAALLAPVLAPSLSHSSCSHTGHQPKTKRDASNICCAGPDPSISCLEGSTMRIPLGGKSVPFCVVKRRGSGMSSVVFECRREGSVESHGVAAEDDFPEVVTVKVLSGGAAGMGTCLREVETLAFLKVKRAEAGLTRGQARFAELASWFYRRSAIGGVDHVFLVFRGGGVSLREAMQERASPVPSVVGGISKQPSSVWQPSEVVAVARGLLEGIVFLHSVGVIHADLKPENVALYPPASSRSPISNPTAKSGSHDIRNGNLNNNSYASSSASAMAVDAPVASGTPPPLGTPMTPNTVNHRPSSSSSSARHLDPRPSPEPHQPPPPQPFDLRLIDLGNAVRACDTVPAVTAGTPSYLSPEARAGEAWGPPVDVWAVGCILFEIVTGWRVGSGTAAGGVGGKGAGEGAGLANLQGSVLEGMMDLVKSLLTEDVQSRPSARQALTHPVFSMA